MNMQAKAIRWPGAGLLVCAVLVICLNLQTLLSLDWSLSRWQRIPSGVDGGGNKSVPDVLKVAKTTANGSPTNETSLDSIDRNGGLETTASASPANTSKIPFAYIFYATSDPYACSVLVNIHRLQSLLHAIYPIHVLASTSISPALLSAFHAHNVTVHIEPIPPLADGGQQGYYQNCLLKLLAFKMHILAPGLQRVLALDADQLVMKNLDHLFTGLPEVDLAAPRAYWLAKDYLASTFLMISLSDRLWDRIEDAMAGIEAGVFDMDLINEVLGDTVMLLSGEYVTLNSHWEAWSLPNWYHPSGVWNETAVEVVNEMSKEVLVLSSGKTKRAGVEILNSPRVPSDAQPSPRPPPRLSALPAPVLEHVEQKIQAAVPRFPATHPLTEELTLLQDAASVIHFTATGKPWMMSPETVRMRSPDAHPVLAGQFEMWHETAHVVCPKSPLW